MKVSPNDVKYRVVRDNTKVMAKGFDSYQEADQWPDRKPNDRVQGYVSDHRRIGARIMADARRVAV